MSIALIWGRLVEASFVIGAACAALVLGFLIIWMMDSAPSYKENPVLGSHYTVPEPIHPGGYVRSVRSLKATGACPTRTGVRYISKETGFSYPQDGTLGIAMPSTEFVPSRFAYQVKTGLPLGKYILRVFVSCQKNPLLEVVQVLLDLDFEVTPP